MNAIEKRARQLLEDMHLLRNEEVKLEVLIAALTPPEGHVVVTRNEAGQAVAVTRQDDEGRILSVIAEFEPLEGYVLVPVEPTEEEVRATNEAQQEFFDDNVQSQFFSSGHYMEESIRHALRAVRAARPEVPNVND